MVEWVVGIGSVPLITTGIARLLWRYGERPPPPDLKVSAIVVPGAAVWAGGEPSPTLRRRTLAAVRYYELGHAPRICLTGGVGVHGPAEAEVAAQLARDHGVPAEALVVEDRSTSTEENARLSAALLGADAEVLVVTDPYHVWRCERVFARHFHAARGTGTNARWRWRWALREVFVVGWYSLRGRL